MIQENKSSRHFAIKQILIDQTIPNQDKLRIELKKQGIIVTQATLSRDLKELGISRFSSNGGLKYSAVQNESLKVLRPFIAEEIISINSNECLIVIKTLPGCANAVAEYVDLQRNLEIIGTIAGDNTLLIIPSSIKKIKSIINYLRKKLIEGKL